MIRQIGTAIGRRLGTLLAGYLVAQGVGTETIAQITAGVVAATAVAFDLLLSLYEKRSRK